MRRISGFFGILGLISVIGVGTGCNQVEKVSAGKAPIKAETLAQVGSKKITTVDFQNALDNLPDDYKILAESEKGKHKILDNLIKKDLLVLEAETRGYQNDEAVKAKIKDMKEQSRERLIQQIADLQSRLALIDRQVYENVLLNELNSHLKKEGLQEFTLSDDEVETYYQDYARKMKILNPSAKVPELATVRPQIEAILVEEQLIKQLQKKNSVDVKEELFQKLYGAASSAIIDDTSVE